MPHRQSHRQSHRLSDSRPSALSLRGAMLLAGVAIASLSPVTARAEADEAAMADAAIEADEASGAVQAGEGAVPATRPAPTAAADAAIAADPAAIPLARLFDGPALEGNLPRGVKLSPDGTMLTMLRPRDDDRSRYDLWARDLSPTPGAWCRLVDASAFPATAGLSEAERMQRERTRTGGIGGVVRYDWTPDGRAILIPFDGDLFLADRQGALTRLTDSQEGELNPVVSPKGRHVSFVRDRRLWVQAIGGGAGGAGGEARAITPAEGDTVSWGEAEFVAQEELARYTGYWWSPTEERIAVARVDDAPVAKVVRTAIGAGATRTFEQRYPAAGTANALVSLHVMSPDGSRAVEVDLGADRDIYVARVDWAKDGRTLFVQRLNRPQSRLDLLAVDPGTGASRVVLTEQAPPRDWINLSDDYRQLADGSLLWWSQRSGFGHLYRVRDGRAQAITSGAWQVQKLVDVDERTGQVTYLAAKDDPLRTQLYAARLDGKGPIRRLTDPAFSHDASAAGGRLVVTRSNDRQPPQTYLAERDGRQLFWVEENRLDAAHPYARHLASHRPRTFGTIKGPDGTSLAYEMITPPLVPGRRYPVWFQHYGGPSAGPIRDAWGGAMAQHIVDRGYIWFQVENRGAADQRGRAFNAALYGAMGGVEVDDQRAGAMFLKSQGFVDPARIVTYGWSYGGYLTLKKLQADPGLYAAGIAGAPVTKWELYDTAYTERYMGDPRQVPDAYAKANAIDRADRIRDPLLVVHGLSDDNVVFDNTAALVARMQAANVPFEMMVYPGEAHGFTPRVRAHLWNTIFRFVEGKGLGPR